MNPMQRAVLDFHKKFGVPAPERFVLRPPEEALLRVRLIQEEGAELTAAISQNNPLEIADALADLLYVVFGTAVQYGIDIEPIFQEVHRSNMTKSLDKDSGGKVQKGPDYSPPDLQPIVNYQIQTEHIWRAGFDTDAQLQVTEASPPKPQKKTPPSYAQFRKKPVVVDAVRWFKNGDHPEDNCEPISATNGQFMSEGQLVRYFRHPGQQAANVCNTCKQTLHVHGWIDTLEGGHIVCPGDWIIKGVAGEFYPCKHEIFQATYESEDPGLMEGIYQGWMDAIRRRPTVGAKE